MLIKAQRNQGIADLLAAGGGMNGYTVANVNAPATAVETPATPAVPKEIAQAVEKHPMEIKDSEVTTSLDKTTDPPAAPPVPVTPVGFDETKFLNEKFGGKFKSMDEVATAYLEVEKKANASQFYNDLTKKADEYVRGGGDLQTYATLQKLDPEGMTDRDALITRLVMEEKLEKDEAAFLVDRKYRIGQPEKNEDGEVDADVREAQINLKIDSKKAKDYLTQFKAQNLTPYGEQERTELKSSWEKSLPAIKSRLNSITVNSKAGDISYTPSQERVQEALDFILESVGSGMLSDTPDKALEKAYKMAESVITASDFHLILDAALDKQEKDILARQHNTRQPQPKDAPAAPVRPAIEGQIAKMWGVNIN